MKLLLLTAEPVSADVVREAVGDDADDAEVMVVSPALTDSPLRFWTSDADEAIEHARETADETVERLDEAGPRRGGRHRRERPAAGAGGRAADLPGRPRRGRHPPRGRARLPRGRLRRGGRAPLRRAGCAPRGHAGLSRVQCRSLGSASRANGGDERGLAKPPGSGRGLLLVAL